MMEKIVIEIKKVESLSKNVIDFMNRRRYLEYGKGSSIDFKKKDKGAVFFFVKVANTIVAFGMLKPVKITLGGKVYTILAMGRGMSVVKGKEYGRILQAARIHYIKKKRMTSLAFTDPKNNEFFLKSGFKLAKNIVPKLRYKHPDTGELLKDEGKDGIYYGGKDKFITTLMKTKSLAYVEGDFW